MSFLVSSSVLPQVVVAVVVVAAVVVVKVVVVDGNFVTALSEIAAG